jgi:hypothetical protein
MEFSLVLILLFKCTCVLPHLNRIIISHTESLSFSLASMTLTFSFSDVTYDLAMMQKMN